MHNRYNSFMRNMQICELCERKLADPDFHFARYKHLCLPCWWELEMPPGSPQREFWDKWTLLIEGKGKYGCDGCSEKRVSTHLYGIGEATWWLCDYCHERCHWDMIGQGLMSKEEKWEWNQWQPEWQPPPTTAAQG